MKAILDPKVSFVVPCYNLGHLLPECVHSILSQTYQEFEVLIMDDCSPDSTPEVARSFQDPRVKHIRNELNLGHLANYNKGIRLARGQYIWLISADDRLRSPYVLERYAGLLDSHPEVGYVFCPAVTLLDGRETEVVKWAWQGTQDTIFKGRNFLKRLLESDCVVVSAVLARKECYEKVSFYPLDMPYAGDWYIWCVFAVYYDVAYFAEPMVNYRHHDGSMTSAFMKQNLQICFADERAVPWRVKAKLEMAGLASLVKMCKDMIVAHYINQLAWARDPKIERSITLDEFEESLGRSAASSQEQAEIRVRVYAGLADFYYWHRDFFQAQQYYSRALRQRLYMPRVWVKYLLLRMGNFGIRLRETAAAILSYLPSM